MAKKPFAIRVEEDVELKYRALATVLNVDNDVLLKQLVDTKEAQLEGDQRAAYDALMKAWGY